MNNKISLILQREYLTRVRKKSFIIMTLLGPLLFAAMMLIPAWIGSMEDEEEKKIAVFDHTGLYIDRIDNTNLMVFDYLDPESEPVLREDFSNSGYFAYLVISDNLLDKPDALRLFSDKQITMEVRQHINGRLRDYLRGSNSSARMPGDATSRASIARSPRLYPRVRAARAAKLTCTSSPTASSSSTTDRRSPAAPRPSSRRRSVASVWP